MTIVHEHETLQKKSNAYIRWMEMDLVVEILDELVSWFGQSSMLDPIIELFDEIGRLVEQSDDRYSLKGEYNVVTQTYIFKFLRRCWTVFINMPFEKTCQLAHSSEVFYHNRLEPQTHDGMKNMSRVEEVISSKLLELGRSSLHKVRLLDELDELCKRVSALQGKSESRQILLAEIECAIASKRSSEAIEKTHALSDIPLDSGIVRGVKNSSAETGADEFIMLPTAAVNLALTYSRLGLIDSALHAVEESMRVSQQTSNDKVLVYALAVLCQTMDKAVPGSVELQAGLIPGTTKAQRHYLELKVLLRRCLEQSYDNCLPHLVAYSMVTLQRHCLLHPEKDSEKGFSSIQRKIDSHKSANYATEEKSEPIIPGFDQFSKPSQAATLSVDTLIFCKQLSFEANMLAAAPIASIESQKGTQHPLIDIFTPPIPAKTEKPLDSADHESAREVNHSIQTSELLRSAGWQIWGSRRLATYGALRCLEIREKHGKDDIAAVCLIMLNTCERHGFMAFDRLLSIKNFDLLLAQEPVKRVVKLVRHRREVYNRECLLALKIASEMDTCVKDNVLEFIEQKVEVQESMALSYLAGQHYSQADKSAYSAYVLAKNACMPVIALRLLLLRGRIHIESGSWETGMPHICSVLEQYRDMHADMIGAEAAIYMAKIWTAMGLFLDRAIEEIQAAFPIIMAHGSLEVRALARVSFVEAWMKKAGGPEGVRNLQCNKE